MWSLRPLLDSPKGGLNIGIFLYLCNKASRSKNFFSYSTQLSMEFFLLINIKMPTIVGILIFISRKKFMLSSAVQEEILNYGYLIIFINRTNFILS